jgi:hypothetical protein
MAEIDAGRERSDIEFQLVFAALARPDVETRLFPTINCVQTDATLGRLWQIITDICHLSCDIRENFYCQIAGLNNRIF